MRHIDGVTCGESLRVFETIVTSSYYLAGAVIGSYVFGATWEDRKKMELGISDPTDDEPQQEKKKNVDNPDA